MPKRHPNLTQKNQSPAYGFTLIELLVYVGILGIILTALTGFAWNMMSIQAKSRRSAELTHTLTNVSNRLQNDLHQATAVATTSGKLTLTMTDPARQPTVYDISNGQLRVSMGSTGNCPTINPCPLTPTWISISPLIFGSFFTTPSRHVRVTLTGNATADRAEWSVSQTYTISTQLRTP